MRSSPRGVGGMASPRVSLRSPAAGASPSLVRNSPVSSPRNSRAVINSPHTAGAEGSARPKSATRRRRLKGRKSTAGKKSSPSKGGKRAKGKRKKSLKRSERAGRKRKDLPSIDEKIST